MQGRRFFLNVNRGAFSEKTSPGNQAHVFTEITGHLVHINFKETAYGEAMRLHVVDQENFYVLSLFVHSRPANAFFMIMKNLDFHIEMTFKITRKNDLDYFTVHQYGGPVLWFYSQENVHELPQDTIEKKAFLRKSCIEEIIPALQKKINPFPSHLLYKPARKGLQGAYFDPYASIARIIQPISSDEKNNFNREKNSEAQETW